LATIPQGDAGEDLCRRVVTDPDPGPGNQGYEGPDDQQGQPENEQQHGSGAGRDGGVH
jgi:hypothetical protein